MNSKELKRKYYSDFETLKETLASLKKRLVDEQKIEQASTCSSLEKSLKGIFNLSTELIENEN